MESICCENVLPYAELKPTTVGYCCPCSNLGSCAQLIQKVIDTDVLLPRLNRRSWKPWHKFRTLTFTPPESTPSGQFWCIYALIGGVRVKQTHK